MQPYLRPRKPEHRILLTPSLPGCAAAWLPGCHLAYFVSDTVDQQDIPEILSRAGPSDAHVR